MSYSQGREEAVILRFFKHAKVGRFLDVGAYDGVFLSNTRALAELGWGGVVVDASPLAYAALQRTYRDRPDVDCVLAAVTPSDVGPTIELNESTDALSTTDEANRAKWAPTAGFRKVTVPALSAAELAHCFPGPYDFVNVDTEGTSIAVAKALPLADLGVRALCVEHDGHYRELVDQLCGDGWAIVHLDDLNLIVGHP